MHQQARTNTVDGNAHLKHAGDTLHVQMSGLEEYVQDAGENRRVNELVNHNLLAHCTRKRTLFSSRMLDVIRMQRVT